MWVHAKQIPTSGGEAKEQTYPCAEGLLCKSFTIFVFVLRARLFLGLILKLNKC